MAEQTWTIWVCTDCGWVAGGVDDVSDPPECPRDCEVAMSLLSVVWEGEYLEREMEHQRVLSSMFGDEAVLADALRDAKRLFPRGKPEWGGLPDWTLAIIEKVDAALHRYETEGGDRG